MEQTQDLASKPIGKLILSYFIPAFIGVFVYALYNIIDRIFIGNIDNIGADALNGVSVIFPIMLIFIAFGVLFGIGSSILISVNLGRKNNERAELILGNNISITVITSIVISILGFIFKTPLLNIFGATSTTITYADQYLSIILGGLIFQLVGFGLNNIIRSEGNANIAMISMLLSAFVNIGLDYVFIVLLNMGVKGAAYATVISMIVLCIWVVAHFNSSRSVIRIKPKNLIINWQVIHDIIKVGMAVFWMQIAGSLTQGLITKKLIVLGGDNAAGAMGVIISISTMVIMSVISINMAGQPIYGYNYGANNYERVRKCLRISLHAASAICLFYWVIIQLFPTQLVLLFNRDNEELINLGANGLRIALVFLPLVGIQYIANNFFQSIGKANTATALTLLRQIIILIPLLMILPNFWGLNGIWMSLALADILSTAIIIAILYRQLKKLPKV